MKRVRGFDAILSQAPGMIQAIASYMGLPAEQLRSLAAGKRLRVAGRESAGRICRRADGR